MSHDLFLSYKREDEARAGQLARALERAGISVWWDRSLQGADSWRTQIEQALDQARLVVVCWSRLSVGEAGDFVRDEAAHAKAQGKLIPVFIDRVSPPLGFGELQAIDLAHWRGAQGDLFFQDLAALVHARLEGHVPPKPKGPAARVMRRLTWGSAATAAAAGIAAFAFNLLHLQEAVCSVAVAQPYLADACGALHLGRCPTRAERIAWTSRAPGSCEAFKRHLREFPEGVYHAAAISALAARRVDRRETWTPETKRLSLFIDSDSAALPHLEAAKADAVARGQRPAERLCRGFAAGGEYRFVHANVEADTHEGWSGCGRRGRGHICSLQAWAVCALEGRQVSENETCGAIRP
jgi:hypothetical protein